MSGEHQEIKIVGVDKDKIQMSPDRKEVWVIPFKLSARPDEMWQKKFYDVQQKNTDKMKRKATVHEDLMSVEVASADDLQKALDVVKLEIVETNVLCEEDFQTKIKIHQELESLQKKQRDATSRFKEDSDKLMF